MMTEKGPTKIANDDGSCRYRGCKDYGAIKRITRRGWFIILYCPRHEVEAHVIFGDEQVRAVA